MRDKKEFFKDYGSQFNRWSNPEYRVLKLLDAVRVLGNGRGLDLVIVDGEKKPIHKWRFESLRPSDLEEIVEKNPNAEGVGVVPGVLIYDPFHRLAILDIDDLELGTKHLETVFGKDWREKLLGGKDAFVILTGPRPKGEWECDCQSPGVDCKCVNKKTGETKALSELPRGLAVGVRIPNECAPMRCIRGEGIEVRAGSCYEVVYGRHPSGAFYQPARWVGDRFVNIELHELGGGAFVSCEEYKRLVEAIKGEVVGFTEEEWKEWEEVDRIISGPDKKTQASQAQEAQAKQAQVVQQAQTTPATKSIKYRRLGEEQKQKVVEALRMYYKQGLRQNLWLAISGWGAWYGIHPLDIADVLLRLYKEAGDTDDLRMRGATIAYSYAKRSLPVDKQELAQVLGVEPYGPEALHEEKVSWKKLLKEVLGNEAKEVIKTLREVAAGYFRICVEISKKDVEDDTGDITRVASEYICNTVKGVLHRRVHWTREGVTRQDEKLLNWSFVRLETYYDKYFDITYANAVVRNPMGMTKEYSMIRIDKLKRELEESGLVRQSPRWDVLLYSVRPRAVDIIVSGFVCPPPHMNLPCTVRDYFNIGLAGDVDVDKAREAITTLVNITNKYHPEPDVFMRAYAYGAFTNFTLTWKLHGLKPKLVTLIGAWDSGKTTTGVLQGWSFSPNIDIILSTSTLLSPARAGRGLSLLTDAVVTTPIVFDEAATTSERGITRLEGTVANVLKNYVTQKYTWITAIGEKIPATSGAILTANQLVISDPALEEKIAFIHFTRTIPDNAQKQGSMELMELRDKLTHFGRYYLNYAANNWASVRDVVLNPRWEEAAIQYFNTVLQSLGLPPLNIQVERRQVIGYMYTLRERLQSYVREYQSKCRDQSFFECLETLVRNDYIPFMKAVGPDKYRITREIERELGISVKQLCQELGGEYVTNTRNPKYYGTCVVDINTLNDQLGIAIPEVEQAREGGDSSSDNEG